MEFLYLMLVSHHPTATALIPSIFDAPSSCPLKTALQRRGRMVLGRKILGRLCDTTWVAKDPLVGLSAVFFYHCNFMAYKLEFLRESFK